MHIMDFSMCILWTFPYAEIPSLTELILTSRETSENWTESCPIVFVFSVASEHVLVLS